MEVIIGLLLVVIIVATLSFGLKFFSLCLDFIITVIEFSASYFFEFVLKKWERVLLLTYILINILIYHIPGAAFAISAILLIGMVLSFAVLLEERKNWGCLPYLWVGICLFSATNFHYDHHVEDIPPKEVWHTLVIESYNMEPDSIAILLLLTLVPCILTIFTRYVRIKYTST